ncbi:peptidase inhibitor family I36 protein [Amycolatopsis albispora]|uniref:peptidase inhibitor family I36 protein n=1 Tax=Amycolatopsis albispora TaxID=1804986 RepID=UPI000DE1C06F
MSIWSRMAAVGMLLAAPLTVSITGTSAAATAEGGAQVQATCDPGRICFWVGPNYTHLKFSLTPTSSGSCSIIPSPWGYRSVQNNSGYLQKVYKSANCTGAVMVPIGHGNRIADLGAAYVSVGGN